MTAPKPGARPGSRGGKKDQGEDDDGKGKGKGAQAWIPQALQAFGQCRGHLTHQQATLYKRCTLGSVHTDLACVKEFLHHDVPFRQELHKASLNMLCLTVTASVV